MIAIANLVRTLGPFRAAQCVRIADNLAKADADIIVNGENVGRGADGMIAALGAMLGGSVEFDDSRLPEEGR